MLDFLNIEPIEKVTSAIYYAVRTLKHRKNIQLETLETEKSIEEKDFGLKIISAIVDKEKKLLSELDMKTIDKYTIELYNYLDKRNKEISKVVPTKQLDNLQKWRNESVHFFEKKVYNLNYSKKVFISYNEKDSIVSELRDILELAQVDTLDREDIISLNNNSILGFIESSTLVSMAVFILTNSTSNSFRSNQLFELGYLFGKLGRDNIILLKEGDIKMPSDLAGLTYIDKKSENWKFELIKHLDFAGISFDKSVLKALR